MAQSRSVWQAVWEEIKKAFNFREAWQRPEAEKLKSATDTAAMLFVMPAYLLMQGMANADNTPARIFFLVGAYGLCGAASVVYTKHRRNVLWSVYVPQLTASLLLIIMFLCHVFKQSGEWVILIGALALVCYGLTAVIVRRRQLDLVHFGLAFCPLLLVPW
jgi:hypothetical protein